MLSKVFIKLLQEPVKPENAIEYLRVNLGDSRRDADTISSLKKELEDSQNELCQLRRQIEELTIQKSGNSDKIVQNNETPVNTDVNSKTTDNIDDKETLNISVPDSTTDNEVVTSAISDKTENEVSTTTKETISDSNETNTSINKDSALNTLDNSE